MLGLHAGLGPLILVACAALVAYAWLTRRSAVAPLGLRALYYAVAVMLMIQFVAGARMLSDAHWIHASHFETGLLTLLFLPLPALLTSRQYRPGVMLASSSGLLVVTLLTAGSGWWM